MVDFVNPLDAKLKNYLKQIGAGDFDVEVSTGYNSSSGVGEKPTGSSNLIITVENPEMEFNNHAVQRVIAALANIKALSEHAQFESSDMHIKKMANDLRGFIAQGAEIPESFPQWFELKTKNEAIHRPDHALQIDKTDVGVKVTIELPMDMDPTTIANTMEQQKTSIISRLTERVAKYYNKDDREKAIEQMKSLDVAISAEKNEYKSEITIAFRSPLQLEKIKDSKTPWNVTLDAGEAKTFRETNPLNGLPEGNGTPENPALLQKALARAILFDDKKPRDYFHQIAGNKDMQIAIAKGLSRLAQQKPENIELIKQIKAFMEDDIFKEHKHWRASFDDDGRKGMVSYAKLPSRKTVDGKEVHQPGRVEITIPLPYADFPQIISELNKLPSPQVNQDKIDNIPVREYSERFGAPESQNSDSWVNSVLNNLSFGLLGSSSHTDRLNSQPSREISRN